MKNLHTVHNYGVLFAALFLILGLKILIKIAFKHTVIQLSYLIRRLSVRSFKAVCGGEDIYLPIGKLFKRLTHIGIELVNLN